MDARDGERMGEGMRDWHPEGGYFRALPVSARAKAIIASIRRAMAHRVQVNRRLREEKDHG